MRQTAIVCLLVLLSCVTDMDAGEARRFQHPSVFSTQSDLASLKKRVTDPLFKSAFEKLKSSRLANPQTPHTPYATVKVVPSGSSPEENAFRNDAQAAHVNALMWVITGDQAHREKAKAILNDWAKTYVAIVTPGQSSNSQAQLEAAWNVPLYVAAADILRYYDNGSAQWKPQDIAAFDQFLKRLVATAREARNRSNNWGTSATLAIMSVAVYQDDEAAYHEAIALHKAQLQKISRPDGSLSSDYLRDPWHPQYTILTWIQTCELAWNQGDDLYSIKLDDQPVPRLAVCLEHFSQLFIGKLPNPKGLQKGDYRDGHRGRQGYDMAFNHYIRRKGLAKALPTFNAMVPDWRPGGVDGHFVGYDTLTHGLISPQSSR